MQKGILELTETGASVPRGVVEALTGPTDTGDSSPGASGTVVPKKASAGTRAAVRVSICTTDTVQYGTSNEL